MKLLDDELKSIRTELKKAIKGRPLYFALMAPGSKKGKFKLSKKKGDTKPADFKKNFNPYEDDKDNNLKGTACQGVVSGDKGVLTFHPQNKPPGAALKFLDYFVLREVKFKQVKDIVFAEPSENLPDVPDESPLDGGLNDAAVRERLEELRFRLDSYDGPNRAAVAKALLEAQTAFSAGEMDAADEQLDVAEELLDATSSAATTAEPHLASAPTQAADLGDLQKRLDSAKDKAGTLPPGLLSNLASLITGAQKAISAADPDLAEDAVIELEEAIDGAYQDFFLQNLRVLVGAQETFSEAATIEFSNTKKVVGQRNWPDAMTSFEKLKELLASSQSTDVDDEDPEAEDDPAPPELDANLKKLWQRRVSDLKPELAKVIDGKLPEAEQITKLLRKGAELLQKNDFDQATLAAEAVENILTEALKKLSATDGSSAATTDTPTAETFAGKKQMVGQQIKDSYDLIESGLLEQSEIATLLKEATKYGEAFGEVDTAEELLNELELMLAGARFVETVEKNGPQLVEVIENPAADGRVVWQLAKEDIGSRISELQKKLRAADDQDLQRIGEYGLHGITGRFQVGLRAALMDMDRSDGDVREKSRLRAIEIIDEYAKFVDSDPLVKLVDENPFDVKVEIRTTLGNALRDLRKTLAT